jgi:HK97 family phage prohead protease
MAHVAIDCRNFNGVSDSMKDRIFKSLKSPHVIPFKKKEFAVDAPLVIEGYGNIAKPDRGGEVMPKECWDLTNYLLNPVFCRDHCWEKVVGIADTVEARDEGLFVRGPIGVPTEFGLTACQIETRSLVAQGFLKMFSVGFIPWEMTYDEEQDLIIYGKAELLEVSLVTIPMQQESMFNVVKSMLLKNDPITIGGKRMATKATTEGDETGTGEGEGKPEGDKPMMDIVNKMYAELQENTKVCKEIHAKACGGEKPKELSDAEAMIKELNEKVEQLTTELNAVKAEKEEIEKSAEKLLALVENK